MSSVGFGSAAMATHTIRTREDPLGLGTVNSAQAKHRSELIMVNDQWFLNDRGVAITIVVQYVKVEQWVGMEVRIMARHPDLGSHRFDATLNHYEVEAVTQEAQMRGYDAGRSRAMRMLNEKIKREVVRLVDAAVAARIKLRNGYGAKPQNWTELGAQYELLCGVASPTTKDGGREKRLLLCL